MQQFIALPGVGIEAQREIGPAVHKITPDPLRDAHGWQSGWSAVPWLLRRRVLVEQFVCQRKEPAASKK